MQFYSVRNMCTLYSSRLGSPFSHHLTAIYCMHYINSINAQMCEDRKCFGFEFNEYNARVIKWNGDLKWVFSSHITMSMGRWMHQQCVCTMHIYAVNFTVIKYFIIVFAVFLLLFLLLLHRLGIIYFWVSAMHNACNENKKGKKTE